INGNVERCIQTQPFPTLLQLAGSAFRQWLAGNDPRVNAAVPVLGAYNTCVIVPGPGQDRPERNYAGGSGREGSRRDGCVRTARRCGKRGGRRKQSGGP